MRAKINKAKFRLMDRLRGTEALKFYQQFLETQWLSAEAICDWQWERVQNLLHHAYDHVPYYRKLFSDNGMHPNDIGSWEDFRRIPILSKRTIRANSEAMLADNRRVFHPHKKATSGSTGAPLQYFLDKKSHSTKWAIVYRLWHLAGWRPGDKVVFLGGTSLYPSVRAMVKWLYVRLNNWLLLSAFDMSEKNMRLWANRVRRFNANYMHAYASSAYLFAKFVEQNHITDVQFKAVFTTAEPLLLHYRETIRRVFNSEVFDLYGAADGGGFAFECEQHYGLHCASESCVLEVIRDGQLVNTLGDTGEIISTDLFNYAMPFIRYKVDDVARVGNATCKCGRGLLLLQEIKGRSHDYVQTSDGTKVHGEFFDYLFREMDWVSQFQIIQQSESDLLVYVNPSQMPQKTKIKWIQDFLSQKFAGMRIEVILTGQIPKTRSGKFNYIVNKLSNESLA